MGACAAMSEPEIAEFESLMKPVMDAIADTGVTSDPESKLNAAFPPDGETLHTIERACHDAIAAGWMCTQGGEGRRFGRIVEPSYDTRNLSVDVVDLIDIVSCL